jgi:hypothetical protein
MTFRTDLVDVAITEWIRFGSDLGRDDKFIDKNGKTSTDKTVGKKKESVEPYRSRVADYWLAINSTEYKNLVKMYENRRGKLDGDTKLAWSAAFISYCFQSAGAGTVFPYSAGHVTWMNLAIKNGKAGKHKAPLVGYKPGDKPLQVGDLIGRPRGGGVLPTYDTAVAKGWYESHSDIVVEVDIPNRKAYVIGGNVGQSVSKDVVTIDAEGHLNDDGGWIVHIVNNIRSGATVTGALPRSTPLAG